MAEYEKRGYEWPLPRYVPDTPGWRNLMEQRYEQVMAMEESGDRYSGFMTMASSALTAPNFTEYGFGLARAPPGLVEALRQGIYDGLPTAREEHDIPVILGERPLFVDRPDLTSRVLREMQPYAEAWAGVPLKAYTAYGFRLYRNNSQLMMHTDRSQTHVVSFILHIASSEGSEPWPILIEDFAGRTHSVVLTPGDVLFYESSKCNHGRPIPFRGGWYTSVFVHYYPDDGKWEKVDHDLENHYSVPPAWRTRRPSSSAPRMAMAGMSFREPDCEHDWCRVNEAIQWSGPGVEGYWINPNQEKIPLNLGPPRGTPSTLSTAAEEDEEEDGHRDEEVEVEAEEEEEEEAGEEEAYEGEEWEDEGEEWDEEEEWEDEL